MRCEKKKKINKQINKENYEMGGKKKSMRWEKKKKEEKYTSE